MRRPPSRGVSQRLAPLGRWALVSAIVLMGVTLLVTVAASYRNVTQASELILRGQAAALEEAVRSDISDLGRMPTDDELAVLVEAHAAEGLRFVAVVAADGTLLASGGAPIASLDGLRDFPPGSPPQVLGDRVRVVHRGPPRRPFGMRGGGMGGHGGGGPMGLGGPGPPGGPGARGGWPHGLVLELEPREAQNVRSAAVHTVGIGALAALTLMAVAAALVRWFNRREAEARVAERDRRLASLGQLSAVLAHEIRNPLASLKGNAQLLAQALPTGEKPRAKAERVVDEAIRLEKLTNDLLEFAKTGDLRRALAAPGPLLEEAAAAVDAAIQVDAGAAPASFSLDAARITQVLKNLLENAVQAGPPVSAGAALEEGHLVFTIDDHGPGVPPEDRERIFEPFFTGRTRGTGLGLAVAKRFVELHGGHIAVGEAPGGGARFRVLLPEV